MHSPLPLPANNEYYRSNVKETRPLHLLDLMYRLILDERVDFASAPIQMLSITIKHDDTDEDDQDQDTHEDIIHNFKTILEERYGNEERQNISTIPSASRLWCYARVRCSPIHEGVSRIKFEQASSTWYLPVITMNARSEVIIRNLMVYETAMSKSKLEFARYINLLSGIAYATEDVRLLRQAGVIKGDLTDNEIATLFSTMQRSFVRSSGSSNVEIAMEKVNKYYDQRLIVRARRGLKKNIYVSWKFLPVALSISLSCCYFFRHFALCMAVTMSGAIQTRMMSINPRYCRNNLVLKFFNYLDLSYIS
ncbi:hypothetical protein K7X08_011363 [Anisodus acutangulus]|uniref:Uncharacterized protein n=1 Tax=Anisodus acutangulus TaxID=402998 RepID=A0A9Q1MPU7_9SOLA|nr:hypothetical protein K7X08_011363 [Anisodus acutangulus]